MSKETKVIVFGYFGYLANQLDGQYIYFPVAIFQYALRCYDLWLIEKDEVYKNKFIQCTLWTLDKKDEKGRWDNFSHIYKNAPYGAMAQGEGASVLLRACLDRKCKLS